MRRDQRIMAEGHAASTVVKSWCHVLQTEAAITGGHLFALRCADRLRPGGGDIEPAAPSEVIIRHATEGKC